MKSQTVFLSGGNYTTVPLPEDDAKRVALALVKKGYTVELRREGSGYSLAYAPPPTELNQIYGKSVREQVSNLISRLYRRKKAKPSVVQATLEV